MPSQFRTRAKELALTWPKNNMTKESLLANVKKVFGESLIAAAIAQEEHKDGTPHLHAWIHRSESSNLTGSQLLALTGKQGNYQPCKSRRDWLRYVTKSDDHVLLHGIEQQFIDNLLSEKKGAAFAVAASQVVNGMTLREINAENPGFVLNHMRKLKEYIPFVNREKEKAAMPSWDPERERLVAFVEDVTEDNEVSEKPERQIAAWLINNIKQKRPLRTRSLWLWSRTTAMGKTTLIVHLQKFLSVYLMPKDEQFFDQWEDGAYDLIILDEYKSQHKMQVLNEWAGGSAIPLRVKGSQGYKKDNLPMIICSNFPPEECYPKASKGPFWTTFMARWLVVELTQPLNVVNGYEDNVDEEDKFDYDNI